jgi:ATP-dependent Clp protease adaptor protein ClpS
MKEKALPKDDSLRNGGEKAVLVLYNDDVNTFDHVIKSLVEICGHDPVQAEQCATIVHYHGSCEIKCGMPGILEKMSSLLNLKGLDSKVRL